MEWEQARQTAADCRDGGRGAEAKLKESLRLLKLCDDLSLFLCLNEPGQNDHPWYRDGFRGEVSFCNRSGKRGIELRIDPSPFRCSFEVTIPYQVVAGTSVSGAGKLIGFALFIGDEGASFTC